MLIYGRCSVDLKEYSASVNLVFGGESRTVNEFDNRTALNILSFGCDDVAVLIERYGSLAPVNAFQCSVAGQLNLGIIEPQIADIVRVGGCG